MIQTALMGQYILLHPKANSKLQALLRGTPLHRIFFCKSWDELSEALECFKHPEAVYLRFSHIANFQPKFYVGSTSSFVLDREHSRYRKFLQVQQNKFVLAEVALRFWCRYDNFWMWSVFPIYTNHQEIQLLGFGTSLNSTVATSSEHTIHLPIFQLPKRHNSTHDILRISTIWDILSVAQTTVEIYSHTCSPSSSAPHIWTTSTTLGSYSGPGQQLHQTIPHGKTHSLQRIRPTRMLLPSPTCKQPWRTTTILCNQCHRPSSYLLESQTSTKTCTSSGTLAPGT